MSSNPQPNPERVAVSVEDAAVMAGIGRTSIYAALGSASLPSLKIGKRRLIRVEALKAWIASHEDPAGTEAA